MPMDFGDGLLICIAKVGAQRFMHGNAPRTEETRPLTLRNTEAKLVAAVNARALIPGQQTHVIDTATGFVSGRQLVSNPIVLDGHARMG